jgi:hypothetical protein
MKTNTADSHPVRHLVRHPVRHPVDRALAGTAVLLLHLALLGGLSAGFWWPRDEPAPGARAPESQPEPEPEHVTWLRLFPAETAARPAAAPAPRPATAPQPALPSLPRRAQPAAAQALSWVPPTAPVAEASPAAAPAPAPAPAPAAAAGAALEAPRPLNLSLPPSLPRPASAPWRNPALNDPRSNTRTLTLEARLARLMGPGDGPVSEEALPDGSRRFRRGTQCVVVRPSRAGTLDAFNQSVSPKAQQVDSC